MSAVTSSSTKPATTSQVSNILWQTAGYALEGAAITGLVVLAPHLVKGCLSIEQAKDFFLLVPDIHDAVAWTATATLLWPIGRHAHQAGTAVYQEVSALPKKVGNYFYSLFPTKTYDVKRDTPKLLYQNSIWGAAVVSTFLGTYIATNQILHVLGLDYPIFPLGASCMVTGFLSYHAEKVVRDKGKTLVDTLDSSKEFRSLRDISKRGWDFSCSIAAPMGITFLVGAAFPLQSAIASSLKGMTGVTTAVLNSYPSQAVIKTAVVMTGLAVMLLQGLFAGATYVGDKVTSGVSTNYKAYVHPVVSESNKFIKTAVFYSTIQDLCNQNGTASDEVKDALKNGTQTYKNLHASYKKIWENTKLIYAQRIPAGKWLDQYPADLADRCPYAENITQAVNQANYIGTITKQAWNSSWTSISSAATQTGKVVSDPTTQKVALLALAAGISLYWVHFLGTKAVAFLSPKKEKTDPVIEDAIALKKEEFTPEEHIEPVAAPLEEEKKEDLPVLDSASEEPSEIKPLAARTWTTKLSERLLTITKKIQTMWTSFFSTSSYYFTKSASYCDDLWQDFKRKMASIRRTPHITPT